MPGIEIFDQGQYQAFVVMEERSFNHANNSIIGAFVFPAGISGSSSSL